MSIKYSGSNVLTYLLQLLNTKFGSKVDKVEGKGLSTNDYTTNEKTKLSGIAEGANNYSLPDATAILKGGVKIGTNIDVASGTISVKDGTSSQKGVVKLNPATNSAATDEAATPSAVKAAYDLANTANGRTIPTLSTNIESDATSDSKSATPKAVKSYVDGKISSTYKPSGSVAFASLPSLGSSVLGNVYNVTDAFNTTADFVEGAGKSYSAGTNVVVVSISGSYKFDVLAGMIDLSGYTPTNEIIEYTNAEIDAIWNAVFTS